MKQTVLLSSAILLIGLMSALPLATAHAIAALPEASVLAAGTPSAAKSAACTGIGLTGNGGCGDAGVAINSIIASGVNIFATVIGVVAVIMIMVGGLRYITSGGDPSKIASAKNTLIYAIVGLVVAALAEVIVHFVLTHL